MEKAAFKLRVGPAARQLFQRINFLNFFLGSRLEVQGSFIPHHGILRFGRFAAIQCVVAFVSVTFVGCGRGRCTG
ncbi:MAG: hypothetical protein DME73_01235 [Verrucomicrobia bacterium]|nr:MAG: hypothetical protein DME73_01235 [Verrucomicrobiota bacterium]